MLANSIKPPVRRSRRFLISLVLTAPALVLLMLGGGYLWTQFRSQFSTPTLPALDAPQASDRIVLFAPHPDDETLGAGGYLQKAVKAGASVRVVLMTNGEYGRTGIDNLPELPAERVSGYEDFGIIRQQETLMALSAFGIPRTSVTFLCYPNHLLAAMRLPQNWLPGHPVYNKRLNTTRIPFQDAQSPGAPYCGQSMLQDVEQILLREKPTVVITLNPNDIHPDHWATWFYTRYALCELAEQGQAFARTCRVYTYLIHRGSWPQPKEYLPQLELLPPSSLLNYSNWRQLPLSADEVRIKGAAIALFQTQGGATHPFMRSFIRRNDLYAIPTELQWPASDTVEPTLVIQNPVADFQQGQRYPSADIRKVTLGRKNGKAVITITTQQPAVPSTTFYVAFSAGGAKVEDRLLAAYQWQAKKSAGTMLQNGKLVMISQRALQSSVDESTATLQAPWPLADGTKFFLLQAWTAEDKHSADVTAAVTFLLPGNADTTP